MGNTIKIFRVYHNEEVKKVYKFNNDGIREMYDTSKNPWGPYLNEFCVLFDDNIQPTEDFIGLEHYRRTFSSLTNDSKRALLGYLDKDTCYTYSLRIRVPQISYLGKIGLNKYRDQLVKFCRESEDYKKEAELIRYSGLQHWRGMFIMSNENFYKLRKFAKDCLNYLFKENNIETPEDLIKELEWLTNRGEKDLLFGQPLRTFAYIFEFLIDVWIRANMREHNPISNIDVDLTGYTYLKKDQDGTI